MTTAMMMMRMHRRHHQRPRKGQLHRTFFGRLCTFCDGHDDDDDDLHYDNDDDDDDGLGRSR